MANERPRHIMRNAALFLDRENYLGQASEIGFPELKMLVEEVFNGGMMTKIEVQMGYDLIEVSFKFSGFDPTVMQLWGLKPGAETELMATAANVDDDGTTHSMTAYLRGFIKDMKPDAHKRGDLAELEYGFTARSYRLEIDGQEIYDVDPFEVRVGGQSQTAHIRRALLIA